MRSARFWVVALLISLTVLLLHLRGDVDLVPAGRPLSDLPVTIGARTATDFAIDPENLQILGKGEFLNRVYRPPLALQQKPVNPMVPASAADIDARAPVELFIAYFPTQRTGQSIHSPQNCLPGAGWTFTSSWVTTLSYATGKKYQVREFLITDGNSTQEVLYWYQLHGRVIAGDYAAKLYTLADSIRYGRTDEALVRIITPVEPGEERLQARNRAVAFAEQIEPLLPAYVPN